MMLSLSRIAGWSAYFSVAATWLGFIFLALFFSIGQPFGTLNDAISVLQVLSMIPIALVFHQLLRGKAPQASLVAIIIGIGAMLVIAAFQSLIVVNAVYFYYLLTNWVLTAGGGVGVWLILINVLSRQQTILPNRLIWLGLTTGVGYIVLVIGFLIGNQENILFIVGSLAVVIVYPIWAIWLGRRLASGKVEP